MTAATSVTPQKRAACLATAYREDDYSLDLGRLQKSLQRLQLMVHPDKHSNKGDDVRYLAEQQSSRLNKAFTTLRSPLERAKYLVC